MQKNSSIDSLSPEQLRILEEADLKTLCEFFKMCKKQKMKRNALVKEIENKIYIKWIKETNYVAHYFYKSDRALFYEDVQRKEADAKKVKQ
ncbi:MAG: hypothetical protein JW836_16310 [Deltaproteobacteria bacterium]|nr:hypothetical protein [Deltaproteobacteria bacterium]